MKKNISLLALLFLISTQLTKAQCSAGFTFNVSSNIVTFTNTSTGGSPLTYWWTFGGGLQGSPTQNPICSYQYNGDYLVCLDITDTSGCTDTLCQTVTISGLAPVLSAYLDYDTGLTYCTSPASVDYMYYIYAANFTAGDSLFSFNVNFGDGLDTSFTLSLFDTVLTGTINHVYQSGGTYPAQIKMIAQNLDSATGVVPYPVHIFSTCGPLSGSVYNDINSNCINDPGEELGGVPLFVTDGMQFISYTTTDATGLYSFNVPAGVNYSIFGSWVDSIHFTPLCPPLGIITTTVPSSGNDFGLYCPLTTDLKGGIITFRLRPGFTSQVCVNIYNQHCTTPTGEIDLVFPASVIPQPDPGGIGYTISGDTVIFPIHSPEVQWSFCIPIEVPLSAQIGDSARFELLLQPVAGDVEPIDNDQFICRFITNSFDPNDKSVVPPGEGADGFIIPATDLEYTIRFQNTGNAEAINIFILDTLSQDLDIATAELTGSSHPATLSVLPGNILRFSFDNILLADSTTNEPASHGYVRYRVKQVQGIAQSAVINNTAGIYFDFNQPIITNTTVNTIDYFLSTSPVKEMAAGFSIYPNPADKVFRMEFQNDRQKIISITGILGKEIMKSKISTHSFSIRTDQLMEGMYIVNVMDEKGKSESHRLIIQHKIK